MADIWKFFDASFLSDLRNFELLTGLATSSSGGNPNTFYAFVVDAFRGLGDPGVPVGSSARVAVVPTPAGMPMPQSTCLRLLNLNTDGAKGQAGLTATEINWQNVRDTTYQSHANFVDIDGGRLGTARHSSLIGIAGGQSGTGSGFGQGTYGDTHIWKCILGFDAANPTTNQDYNVAKEMHHNGPGPAPGYYINCSYDQFRQLVRGGDGGTVSAPGGVFNGYSSNGTYYQRHNYWDEAGHIDTLYGPPGGGGSPFYSIHDPNFSGLNGPWSTRSGAYLSANCVPIQPPVNPDPLGSNWSIDYRYPNRGHFTKGTCVYELIERTRYSDRETTDINERYFRDNTAPVCSVPGFHEMWMRKWTFVNGIIVKGPWINIVPRWYGATAFSVIDPRSSSSIRLPFANWFIWLIYRGTATVQQTVYFDQVWHGDSNTTPADMAADGTDPEGGVPVTPPSPVFPPSIGRERIVLMPSSGLSIGSFGNKRYRKIVV